VLSVSWGAYHTPN